MDDYSKKPIPEELVLELRKYYGDGKYINPNVINKQGYREQKEQTVPLTRMLKPMESEGAKIGSAILEVNASDMPTEQRKRYADVLLKKTKENSISVDKPYKLDPEKRGVKISEKPDSNIFTYKGMVSNPSSGKLEVKEPRPPGKQRVKEEELLQAADAMGVTANKVDGVDSYQAGENVDPSSKKRYMDKLFKMTKEASPRF
jgi:hypothetical protein